MANIQDLPLEILSQIFCQISGKDLWSCRRVNKSWLNAIDALPDLFWRRICSREYGDRSLEFSRARLSWREMYRSLSLWKQFKQAKVVPKAFPTGTYKDFQLLNDGTISAVKLNFKCQEMSTDIIYFDADTFKEIKRLSYGIVLHNYQENDTFIVFFDFNNNLHITLKVNGKQFNFGEVSCGEMYELVHYSLHDKEVLFQNSERVICVAKVVQENGEATIKLEEKGFFEWQAIAISYTSNNGPSEDLHILSEFGQIYHLKDSSYNFVDTLNCVTGTSALETMISYGYDWSKDFTFQWIINYLTFSRRVRPVFKLDCTSAWQCPEAVFLGVKNKIKVYIEDTDNTDFFYNGSPDRIIDLREIVSPLYEIKILKMSIVERVNGHRLFALLSKKNNEMSSSIFVFDFVHDRRSVKERPLRPVLRLKNVKAKTAQHKYRTRGSLKRKIKFV